jgi:hypothetical protein
MTTRTTKTTKPTDDATIATEATGTKAARSGTKAKPSKTPAKAPKARQKPAVADTNAKAERALRTDTKQAKLIAMLQAKDGATVAEIASAFDWQAHTVRGALYGALKKKLGLDVASEKVEGRGRVYRIGN